MLQKLSNWLFTDYQLKLTALVMAVVVWFYANNQLKVEANLRVPLVVRLVPGTSEEYRLIHQSHDSVQLRVRGPENIIQHWQGEAATSYLRMTTVLNPPETHSGSLRLEADPAWLNVSESELAQIRVVSMDPDVIQLEISPVVTRTLAVEVKVGGKPREGYEIGSIEALPRDVKVTAPAVVLDGMKSICTQEVALWDAQQSLQQRDVPLVLEETFRLENGEEQPVSLAADPPHVMVFVTVKGLNSTRTLEGVVVESLRPPGFPYDAEMPAEETRVSVTISGLPQDVARVTPESLLAYIPLGALKDEKIASGASAPYKEKVQVMLRENLPVTIERCEPVEVTVVLTNPAP